jgi:predicted RNA-binding Zn-ribbon protein involved in translation (DUF1610 family)
MNFSGLFSYVPPTKLVSDYDESEKAQFQKAFQPRTRDYRYFRYLFGGLLVVAFAFLVFSKEHDGWYLFFGLFGIYIIFYNLLFKPVCPACKRNVAVSVRIFCPECGSRKISSGGFMRSRECLSCGKILRQGRNGRMYKVRYCTHCGVFLHPKGI